MVTAMASWPTASGIGLPSLRLLRLSLNEFRNYPSLNWQPASRISLIVGPNGSGKTNLLEAVSLLLPGRGLRRAHLSDLGRRVPLPKQPDLGRERPFWAVAGRFAAPGKGAVIDIGTGTGGDAGAEQRQFRVDGVPVRRRSDITGQIAMTWLTPAMDQLFREGATGRRRFLDRLVSALEPAHARDLAGFENAMTRRNRLLAENVRDASWLSALEDSMARHAVSIAAARKAFAARLNGALNELQGLPAAQIVLECSIAERLGVEPALDAENWLHDALGSSREVDRQTGSASHGTHRSDMQLINTETGLDASLSSTGQQKALLLSVVLAHAAIMAKWHGYAPLILLDEPLVHLDEAHRAALFTTLAALPAQVLLSSTDLAPLAPLKGLATAWSCGNNTITSEPAFPIPQIVNAL